MSPAVTRRRFPARLDALHDICDFAVAEARRRGLPENRRDAFRLAVEEGVVNVCRYAYAGVDGEVELAVGEDGGLVVLEMSDDGVAFDPLASKKPGVGPTGPGPEEGGLGIHLMRRLAHGVAYRRDGNRNVLVLAFEKGTVAGGA